MKWSNLAKSTRTRYARQGVTGVRYNAWNRLAPAKKQAFKRLGISRDDYLTAPSLKDMVFSARATYAAKAAYVTLDNAGVVVNLESLKENLSGLTARQLTDVPKFSADELRKRARTLYRRVTKSGKEVNPYWYH